MLRTKKHIKLSLAPMTHQEHMRCLMALAPTIPSTKGVLAVINRAIKILTMSQLSQ